ncbi:MAG: HDIG domain-containing metalloprotein [Verrucomicrobiota bacterium]
MAPLFRKLSFRRGKKLEKTRSVRKEKGRNGSSKQDRSSFLETGKIIEAGVFLVFSGLVVVISFLGQKPIGPQLILNQNAPERIVAEFNFGYISEIEEAERAREVRAQVPPIFQRSFEPYERFRELVGGINSAIAKAQIEHENEGEEALRSEIERTTQALIAETEFEMQADVLNNFIAQVSPRQRSNLLGDAMSVLKEIYEDGVYTDQNVDGESAAVTVIRLVDEDGETNLPRARSMDDALVALRVRINALSSDSGTARSLFELFRAGLQPNLLYSASGTRRAIDQAVAAIEPNYIQFEAGDTLIEPGELITEIDLERIAAYQEAEQARGSEVSAANRLFLERIIYTSILLLAVFIYLKQGLQEVKKRTRAVAIIAVSILLNLIIIRIITEIGELTLLDRGSSVKMLTFIAPYALAPIIVAGLVGAGPAVLCSLIISVLFGIIQDNSLAAILIAFFAGVTGSFMSTNVRKRSKLVQAGLVSGMSAVIAGAAIAMMGNYSLAFIGQQSVIAMVVGGLTGIAAIGLIPVFEQIFKITTDITLLEMTDFNHPLLRRMQIEAPGTYHHSLMVANLSENAAASIGANPLLCRACCFFHDIGKLVKPEYFAENQHDNINPHNEKNPSMSALVIKAHVKEGVELARKFKLPRVIIDVIRQHHGTSLIQYFYYQAKEQERRAEDKRVPFPSKNNKSTKEVTVDESTYRYDGPKPEFKESAIIFFADGVEAASRSLRKVTQPAIEELIDSIFTTRIQDGQLDDCPLTFQELNEIKKSFVYTLLNMLHSRVEYPKEKQVKSENIRPAKEVRPASSSDEPDSTGNQQAI